jgi:diguanylate cyclase (GGDEF)-like protein
MKKSISAFVVVLGYALAAWAETPATLTSLHAVHSLSHADAARRPPVAFEATVTYRRANETNLFVQDGNEGIYVWADTKYKLLPGDRVLVRGKAADSFRPSVTGESVTLLHHGALPTPVLATFDDLIHAKLDCVFVSVRGVIHSADLGLSDKDVHMELLADGGDIDAYVDTEDASMLNEQLDAEVEVSGVATSKFDGKMQQTGVGLSIPLLKDVRILKSAPQTPWALPITQMDEIISNYRVKNLTQRVRVHGTITYYQPNTAIVLQSGGKSLWIRTRYEKPLQIGDEADVTGFPNEHEGFLTLDDGEIQENPAYAPITPQPISASQLTSSKNIFDLVSIEGQVVMEVRENAQDEYVLVSDGQVFSAIYRHPLVGSLLPLPMNHVPLGSRVRVAGICIPLDNSNPFRGDVPFNLLMRTPEDIAVIARPSLLNVRNLMLLVGLLLAAVLAVGARGWMIERRMRRQTTALAYVEQRRSHILEDINGSRPLAEIIEQITELVSFKLHGVPCWCQITDGAQLGNRPPKLDGMRIVQLDIPARSGPPLGTVFTAFDGMAKPSVGETQSLSMAVGLAALAIETRRLYTDLVHRSEFDLLTDIHNRFSLEKHLEHQIREARETAGIFGLIYIDLDEFKQVNDTYGHHVGDLYLQEAADRMKRQLRPHDKLARLGGDEFAALVPVVRSRADVEEIARRLERCFDEPFVFQGYTLHGAASVGIALFPEDAGTVDALLSAADAAMYVDKHGKRPIEEVVSVRQGTTLPSYDGE